ncbi:cytochrome P450 71D8-like [Phalaenopsis equestris]|uniref:cytochrome P450 71D8-like n=1 Tax=Phalaenopsis equestris TaxID=78828 RepID=UPI0009E5CFCE|nr:cytochrome P450 71D8-like [Phalaenopsis equestris]
METLQYFSVLLPLITSIFLALIMIKTLKSQITKRKSHNNLPPGPRKFPIIGNLHNLGGEHPHRRLATLSKTYGPIFYLKLGEIDSVVITSPTLAAETMKTHDLNLASRSQFLATKIILYNGGDLVFAPHGKLWAQLRKICTVELFSGKRVKSFVSIMEDVGHNMVEKIRKGTPAGAAVNISELLLAVANTTVSRTAFGRDCEQSDRLFTAVLKSFKYMSGFDLADLYPSLSFLIAGITGLRQRSEKVRGDFDVILNEILEAHLEKAKGEEDDAEEDLVDVMLRLKKSGELEDFITMDNIKAVIVVCSSYLFISTSKHY